MRITPFDFDDRVVLVDMENRTAVSLRCVEEGIEIEQFSLDKQIEDSDRKKTILRKEDFEYVKKATGL